MQRLFFVIRKPRVLRGVVFFSAGLLRCNLRHNVARHIMIYDKKQNPALIYRCSVGRSECSKPQAWCAEHSHNAGAGKSESCVRSADSIMLQ